MNEKSRKLLIIVTSILLVLLVVVGLVMLLNQPSGKKDNEKGKNILKKIRKCSKKALWIVF